MNVYKKLPYDSELFGYPVAAISQPILTKKELDFLLIQLLHDGIKLVYWTVASEDHEVNTIAKTKGLLADEKVTYSTITFSESIGNSPIVSYLNKKPTDSLQSLFLQSGQYSRFKTDTHFVHGEYEELYSDWLQKSLSGKLADDILVYREEETEVGVITVAKKESVATIGIFAVDEAYRGRGIGTALMQAVYKKANDWKVSQLRVATQKMNEPACRFYAKLGFSIEKTENVYHFWLS